MSLWILFPLKFYFGSFDAPRIVSTFLTSALETRARGMKWNLSSRDANVSPLTGAPARLSRAFVNFKESFPFFLAAEVAVLSTKHLGSFSRAGVILYFVARVIYIPLYAFDIVGIRSCTWLLSMAGIGAILLQLVF